MPKKAGWKAAPWCGSTARSPRRRCTNPATARCYGMRCGWMTRLLDRGEALAAAPAIRWRDRRRLAEKRARDRIQPRAEQKAPALPRPDQRGPGQPGGTAGDGQAAGRHRRDRHCPLACRGDHYLPLIARAIVQTQRRVFDGETVPAGDKPVSLFEPHAGIIVRSLSRRRLRAAGRFSTDTSSTRRPARAG